MIGGALGQHRRRKGAKGLAMFDARVDPVFDLRRVGVGQDAAVSQGPWSVLAAALKAGHNLAVGNPLGGFTHVHSLRGNLVVRQDGIDLMVVIDARIGMG